MSDPLVEVRELAEAGKHKEVITACREAGALGPEARELLSASHRALGDVEEAAKQMQKAASGSADPSVLCRAGELWYMVGKYAKAVNEVNKALKISPGDPVAISLKARALISQDKHAEALKCCGSKPSDPRVQAAAGRALYETGKIKEAAKMCKLAFAAPGFAARFYAGLSTEGAEAKKHMATSLDEPHDVDSPAASMGKVLQVLGRTKEALEELNGDDPKSACIKGQILLEAGRQDEALEAFKKSTKYKAQNSQDMYHMAISYYNLGLTGDASCYKSAKKILKDAKARNPGIPGAQELAHNIDEQIKKRREAGKIKLIPPPKPPPEPKPKRQQPARKKPKKPKPQPVLPDASEIIVKAGIFCVPGQCKKALDILEDLSASDASRADAQFCKGMAYYGLAKYEEAHTCFDHAARRDPKLKHQYWRAMSLFRLGQAGMLEVGFNNNAGRYSDAKLLLDKIISSDPLYPGARTLLGRVEYNLAKTLKTCTEQDAARSFREALKADPADVVALYHLGQAHDHAGEATEAKHLYGLAVEAHADESGFHSEPLYCKGYALDLLGQHESALSWYSKALSCDPDYGPDFAVEMADARGQEPHTSPNSSRDDKLEACVVDTNVALPHLSRSKMGFEPNDWIHLAYHRRHFWERLKEGTYILPETCKAEIRNTMRYVLSRYVHNAEHVESIVADIHNSLNNLPRNRWTEAADSVEAADVIRVRRAYWRAWFGMHPRKKEEWVDKKKRDGRWITGGPPLGTDTKILAATAKIASVGEKSGLITDDNDFLMFSGVAAELNVELVRV